MAPGNREVQGAAGVARDALPPDRPLPAQGPVGYESARGHHLYLAGILVFRRRCGSRFQPTATRARLRRPCLGEVSSNDATYLKSLGVGKGPLAGEWVGEPRPLLATDDACFWLRL